MAEVLSSIGIRSIELNAEYLGVSRLLLMENAGATVAKEISARFEKGTKVAVYAGLGGNGGDGFVTARHLTEQGFIVSVILAGKPEDIADVNARKNWEIINSMPSIKTYFAYDSSLIPKVDAEVHVDALLGIGAKGILYPPILQLVEKINESKGFKVAVDVPTGIDSDTGEILGKAVKADLTVTFHKNKKGLLKAKKYVGKLIIAKVGIPPEAEIYAGPGDVYLVRKPRHPEAHKGDFGRLFIIGGSETFSGAPAFVALSALRTGVDLAYVAAPEKTAYAISSMSPDLITVKLAGDHLSPRNTKAIAEWLPKADAVVMGPGLGLHEETREAARELFHLIEREKIPMLLDADALKAFAEFKRRVRSPVIFTPHAGEYKLLTGEDPPKDLAERSEHVRKNSAKLRACILLKGPIDVVSDGVNTKLNRTGNPGMTVGGTGDVLSGIVGTFLAQGASLFAAASAGAFINGVAGDIVLKEKGFHMVPSDLIDKIGYVMRLCQDGDENSIRILKEIQEYKCRIVKSMG